MYYTISANRATGELVFHDDVVGAEGVREATQKVQKIADDYSEILVATITPRTHLLTIHPKKKLSAGS